MMINVTVNEQAKNFGNYRFAWAFYDQVEILPPQEGVLNLLKTQEACVRINMKVEEVSAHPGVQCSRRAFKAVGLDPARYRPSQEALLRRTLQDKPIRPINTGVDINNLLSLKFVVPMGLYDAGQINGNVVIKVGEPAETYSALNGRLIDCRGKWIIRDNAGPFGSPFVDSERTAVGLTTKCLLHVIYFYYEQLSADALLQCQKIMGERLKGRTAGYKCHGFL